MSRAGLAFAGGALCAGLVGTVFVAPVVMSTGALFGGEYKDAIVPVSCGSEATIQTVSRNAPKVNGFTAAQTRNAAEIIRAGQEMKVPPRGWVVALGTALQESGLKNYANDNPRYPRVRQLSMALPHEAVGHDHDSVGLFQQRPVEGDGGWGTVRELMTPQVSARKFYAALLKVDGWQSMPLTRAAQRVQRSAFPSAYAKWEDDAAKLVDALSGGAAKTPVTAASVGRCAKVDEVTSSGWVRPVSAPIGSGFRTAHRPTHNGVDLSAARGLPIKAAAAGTVVHMECDASEHGVDCNRDGSPNTPGCGWYVDIRHAGNYVTRYCHLLKKPLVGAGDKVTAGQQIGELGTSGHSSGPHLHFEVHVKGDRSSSGAIDPVKFMKERGAPLGEGPPPQKGEVNV